MRLTRSLILGLAILTSIGAAAIVRYSIRTSPPKAVRVETATVELLVAGRAISAGEQITLIDLRWQTWPEAALPEEAVSRRSGSRSPPFAPALARFPLMAGEPIADIKLIRPGQGSHAASLIAKGKRAVAVPVRDESAVGGLIQPHDRVDVLWINNSESIADRSPAAHAILRGVKVLAMGKSFQGNSASTGNKTATLELTPDQARILAGARARGEISLSLLSATDHAALAESPATFDEDAAAPAIQVMKFGRGGAVSEHRSKR
jgi:pilus assembly protein CpaB